ncbi:hypothetical protein V7968_16335 [Nocardia vulneris]|uniref:hypothetical protein n=1 Tax=Nocardia vulneris TaxID=1141657 RepID=UPI0030CCA196
MSIIVVVLPLFGCSASGHIANLAEVKQIAASCPPGRQIAGRAAIDVGDGRVKVAAESGRLAPVRELVQRVATCDGHLRIDVFAGSASATAAVFDGKLHAQGATENARLKRVPKMVDEVMATVTTKLPTAASTLAQDGKDVVAQFGLSTEYLRQLDPERSRYVLDVVITTDGAQTSRPVLTDANLTSADAEPLAQGVAAPDLSGAQVRVTDVGKTADRSMPTSYVDALKVFYRTVCQATKADACMVVTDAAGR